MAGLFDDIFSSQAIGLGGQLLGGFLQYDANLDRAQTIIDGGEIAAMGSGLTAEGYRQSAQAVAESARFNSQVSEINFQRNLAAIARQQQLTTGKQLSAQAGSGLALGSKSFLMVQNESRSFFEKQLMQMGIDQENKRRAASFETLVQQANLENKARAQEYQAEAQRVMAYNQAESAKGRAKSNLFGTILSTGISAAGMFL